MYAKQNSTYEFLFFWAYATCQLATLPRNVLKHMKGTHQAAEVENVEDELAEVAEEEGEDEEDKDPG